MGNFFVTHILYTLAMVLTTVVHSLDNVVIVMDQCCTIRFSEAVNDECLSHFRNRAFKRAGLYLQCKQVVFFSFCAFSQVSNTPFLFALSLLDA